MSPVVLILIGVGALLLLSRPGVGLTNAKITGANTTGATATGLGNLLNGVANILKSTQQQQQQQKGGSGASIGGGSGGGGGAPSLGNITGGGVGGGATITDPTQIGGAPLGTGPSVAGINVPGTIATVNEPISADNVNSLNLPPTSSNSDILNSEPVLQPSVDTGSDSSGSFLDQTPDGGLTDVGCLGGGSCAGSYFPSCGCA